MRSAAGSTVSSVAGEHSTQRSGAPPAITVASAAESSSSGSSRENARHAQSIGAPSAVAGRPTSRRRFAPLTMRWRSARVIAT